MMNIVTKILLIIFLSLVGCERDYKTFQVSAVIFGVNELITSQGKKEFSLILIPKENKYCSELRYRYRKFGNSFYIDILGIDVENDCNGQYSVLHSDVNLGTLSKGFYSIQINSQNHNNKALLTIADSSYCVSMGNSDNAYLVTSNWRRVFDNTLWGGFCYYTDAELNAGLSFIDSLYALGVQPSKLKDGDYLYFSKLGNNVNPKMKDNVPRCWENKEIGFVFDYSFNDQKLKNLINKFKYTSGLFYLKVSTGKGTNLTNWK